MKTNLHIIAITTLISIMLTIIINGLMSKENRYWKSEALKNKILYEHAKNKILKANSDIRRANIILTNKDSICVWMYLGD